MNAIVSGKSQGTGFSYEVITEVAIPSEGYTVQADYSLECNGIYLQGLNSPDFAIVNLNSPYSVMNPRYYNGQLGFFQYFSYGIGFGWVSYYIYYADRKVSFYGLRQNNQSDYVSAIVSKIQLIKIS